MHRKPHLPEKSCLCCGRPFAWRKSGLRCGTRSNTALNAADGSASSHLRLGNRHEHGAALVTQRPAPARPTRASRRVQDGGAVHIAGAVPAGHSSQNPLGLCPHRSAPSRLAGQHDPEPGPEFSRTALSAIDFGCACRRGPACAGAGLRGRHHCL